MNKPIYLDYAAATPLDPRVLNAMQPYFSDYFYNASALYLNSKSVAKDLAASRFKVAHWLGSRPSEIIFTAGGTEANNLAIHGIMRQHPEANVVVSSIEHESVLEPAAQYSRRLIGVKNDGRINVAHLDTQIDDMTVLVSVMHANNEIGAIQPIKEVSQLVKAKIADRSRRGITVPLYLHTDACQAANFLDLHAARLGVDLLTLNAGKIYGPKQCGALYIKSGIQLQPLIFGGGQERGLRSGTENTANSIGFASALDIAQGSRHEEGKRLMDLQQEFIDLLCKTIPKIHINGSLTHRLPNNVHITLPGQDNERLLMQLDEQGIMCATGSACTASKEEPSHVLKAIGLTEAEARASLRFTMGRMTTFKDLVKVVSALQQLVA